MAHFSKLSKNPLIYFKFKTLKKCSAGSIPRTSPFGFSYTFKATNFTSLLIQLALLVSPGS